MIKLAARAAFPKTKLQESRGPSRRQLGIWSPGAALTSWILVFDEAALAATHKAPHAYALSVAGRPCTRGPPSASRFCHGDDGGDAEEAQLRGSAASQPWSIGCSAAVEMRGQLRLRRRRAVRASSTAARRGRAELHHRHRRCSPLCRLLYDVLRSGRGASTARPPRSSLHASHRFVPPLNLSVCLLLAPPVDCHAPVCVRYLGGASPSPSSPCSSLLARRSVRHQP